MSILCKLISTVSFPLHSLITPDLVHIVNNLMLKKLGSFFTLIMNNTKNNTFHESPNGEGILPFTPAYAPAAFFTAYYAIMLFCHCILAFAYRKYYGYAIGMICGLLLELLGYIAKVMLSNDRKNKNGYILCTCWFKLTPVRLKDSSLLINIDLGSLLVLLSALLFFPPRYISESVNYSDSSPPSNSNILGRRCSRLYSSWVISYVWLSLDVEDRLLLSSQRVLLVLTS